MDTIVLIMFGSFLCSVTALSFMELRKIRKKLESKQLKSVTVPEPVNLKS
jgi:hypothetical protein